MDNWTYTARNTVLFHLDGAPLTAEERMEQARRNQRVINKAGTRFSEDIKNKPSEVRWEIFKYGAIHKFAHNDVKVRVVGHCPLYLNCSEGIREDYG